MDASRSSELQLTADQMREAGDRIVDMLVRHLAISHARPHCR